MTTTIQTGKRGKRAMGVKLLALCAALLAAPIAFAQNNQTTVLPDCVIPFTFTAAGDTTVAAGSCNRGDNRQTGAVTWTLAYASSGFSVVGVTFQYAQTTGVPSGGDWGTYGGTVVLGSATMTNTTGQVSYFKNGTVASPWVRVHFTKTGTGTVVGILQGWSTGSTGGAGVASNCPQGAVGELQAYVSASACGAASTTVSALPSAAANASAIFLVRDGMSSSDCSMGGGTTATLCESNGVAWASLGGGGVSTCPAGSTGDVQYNGDGTACGADTGVFTYSAHTLSTPITIWYPVAEPSTALTAVATATPGNPNGTYYYFVSFVTASGESGLSQMYAGPIVAASVQINLSDIPISSDPRVTGRRIYRGGDSSGGNPLHLIADNTTTVYVDNLVDPPAVCTSSNVVISSDPCPRLGFPNTTVGLFLDGQRIGFASDGDDGSSAQDFGPASTAFGWKAGVTPRGFGENSFFGAYSGANVTLAYESTGVGSYSCVELDDGAENSCLGHWSLASVVHGNENTAGGSYSATNYEGNDGTFFGAFIGAYGNATPTGNNVTIVGARSYGGTSNHGTMLSGDNTTGIGFTVWERITTGSNGAALGAFSCNKITTGSGDVCLGYAAGPTADQSNKLYINNAESDTPLIGGDFSAHTVTMTASGGVSVSNGLNISTAAPLGSVSAAVCWKTTTTLSYCTSAVGVGGTCTCN